MAEVRDRLTAVAQMYHLRDTFESHAVYEFSYLQYRYIAELIAMACLVAHDQLDESELKKLRTTYKASQIFKKLKHIYPDFLMLPVVLIKLDGNWHFELDKGQSFVSEDLSALWTRSGSILHVGEFQNLHKRKTKIDDLSEVLLTHNRLCKLLGAHRVLTKGNNEAIICNMMFDSDDPVFVAVGVPNEPRP